MKALFDTDTELHDSVLNSQNNDVRTAKQVLQAMKEDLPEDSPEWVSENIEATLEMLKDYKEVQE